MARLNDSTSVPLKWVIGLIVFVVGAFAYWTDRRLTAVEALSAYEKRITIIECRMGLCGSSTVKKEGE